jgi:hypothetical protein
MATAWVDLARAELLARRGRRGAWGYRAAGEPSVEATALVCLGIRSAIETTAVELGLSIREGADWLAMMQRADGSLGAVRSVPGCGWPTAHALTLWTTVEGYSVCRDRAASWLLAEKGEPIKQPGDRQAAVFDHDTTLIGWPWVDGTHSWLEPTALSILALSGHGMGNHPRVAEGARLILDRALPGGGWNYGNRRVFGRELRPQPGPSGLALAALARIPGATRTAAVDQAIAYLAGVLPGIRAPISLGWGILGLRSWGACPSEAGCWLERSHGLHASRPDSTTGLALLLLANQPRGLLPAEVPPPGGTSS